VPRRAASVSAPRFFAQYPATAASVGVIRGEVAAIARECGLGSKEVGSLCLAVSEAVTNAVVHGSAGRGDARVRVRVTLTAGEMRVAVSDDGGGLKFEAESRGLGAGMFIVAAITGRLDIRTSAAGTHVHMAFPVPRAATP